MSSASPRKERETKPSWTLIYEGLHQAIIRHRLDPGAKLVEEEIAEVYGLSRTVVRAALQALARDGVVVLQRHRGASVARPTPEEAREIFEARLIVEPRIADMAAARMTPDGVSHLRACLDAEHRAMAGDNFREAVFQSAEFHRVIAGLAGHAVLAGILSDLLSRSSLVVALYWRRPETMCQTHSHHGIVEALEARDSARAGASMALHLADLLAGLDLFERPLRRSSLSDALRGTTLSD